MDSAKTQRTVNTATHVKDVAVPTARTGANPGSKLPSPVQTGVLKDILHEYRDPDKNILIQGFENGFRIHCATTPDTQFYKNHKSVEQNAHTVQKMISKELSKGRVAGPFKEPPFKNLVISPLGLVEKKEPGTFRVIHDLSFPQNNSVNSNIAKEFSAVNYETLDSVVHLVKIFGRGSLIAKTDIEEAFRLLPIHPDDYHLLGFYFDKKIYFDKCLPMGCSSSCNLFEKLSCALQWYVSRHFPHSGISHILDDFIFVGPPHTDCCNRCLVFFIDLCKRLGIPIKHSKTCPPSTSVVVHGVLFDTVKMEARLPEDKIDKLKLLNLFQSKRKATLRELQSLVGYLNFACKAIVPGRAFKRRISNLIIGTTKSYHHIRLNKSFRSDIRVWKIFLDNFNGRSMFLNEQWVYSNEVKFHSDACEKGGAAFYGSKWFYLDWPNDWL